MLKHQSDTELKSLKYSFYIVFLSEKQNLRFSSNTQPMMLIIHHIDAVVMSVTTLLVLLLLCITIIFNVNNEPSLKNIIMKFSYIQV